MTRKEKFREAEEKMKTLSETSNNEELKKIYALYKQAFVENTNTILGVDNDNEKQKLPQSITVEGNMNTSETDTQLEHSEASVIYTQLDETSWQKVLTTLKYLVIGDERVRPFEVFMPQQQIPKIQFEYRSGANSWKILQLADEALKQYPDTDVLILFGFHYDFVRYQKVSMSEIFEMATPNIPSLIQEYGNRITHWQDKYPKLRIIPTLPYIPDFIRHTEMQLKGNMDHLDLEAQFRVAEYHQVYLKFTNQVISVWKQLLYGYLYSLQKLSRQTGNPRKLSIDARPYSGTTIDGYIPDHLTVERFWTGFPRYLKVGYARNLWKIQWKIEQPKYLHTWSELQELFAEEKEEREKERVDKECQSLQDALCWAQKLKPVIPTIKHELLEEEETIEETSVEEPQPGPSELRVRKRKKFTTESKTRKRPYIGESDDSDFSDEVSMMALKAIEKHYNTSEKKKCKYCNIEKKTSKEGTDAYEIQGFKEYIRELYQEEEENIKTVIREMFTKKIGHWLNEIMK